MSGDVVFSCYLQRPAAEGRTPAGIKASQEQPAAEGVTGNTYALVRVDQVETPSGEGYPSINLTLSAIKHVKYMNMKIPSEGAVSSIGERMKGGLPEEVNNPTMTPESDSALGHLHALVVKTAGGLFAKLYMRKVVKCSFTQFDTVIHYGMEVVESDHVPNATAEQGMLHTKHV